MLGISWSLLGISDSACVREEGQGEVTPLFRGMLGLVCTARQLSLAVSGKTKSFILPVNICIRVFCEEHSGPGMMAAAFLC